MKIRKTPIMDGQAPVNVYIYENRKEEYIVLAIPTLEWSFSFSYGEEAGSVTERLEASLKKRLDHERAALLAVRLLGWAREM
ncbi:YueH family protein [Geobacillus stearothermophilus]|uniref:YueH family protein n=1 Tax=Geobacillus stearothermophilus TaxID=1422 RepID=UPI002E22336B|nr:YueH family protein [Geobacillus stearothermophilus]